MKTKLILILASLGALCLLAPPASAVPADPNARVVLRQPDGTGSRCGCSAMSTTTATRP